MGKLKISEVRISNKEFKVFWKINGAEASASLEDLICGYELFRDAFPSLKDADLEEVLKLPKDKPKKAN